MRSNLIPGASFDPIMQIYANEMVLSFLWSKIAIGGEWRRANLVYSFHLLDSIIDLII